MLGDSLPVPRLWSDLQEDDLLESTLQVLAGGEPEADSDCYWDFEEEATVIESRSKAAAAGA